jgi:hypothetical protein
VQAAWVLIGALDWSRLILGEDGRAGGPDHLGEPWAVPLEEARLTSFLSADKNVSSDNLEGLPDAFLSGRIVDAQSKLNVLSLVDARQAGAGQRGHLHPALQPAGPAGLGAQPDDGRARAALSTGTDGRRRRRCRAAPLMPQEVSQLVWLGLSPSTAAALEPYVTILPVRTTLNLNTASAEAISASMETSASRARGNWWRSAPAPSSRTSPPPMPRCPAAAPLQRGAARRGHPVLRGLRAAAAGPHLGRGALAAAAQRCHGDDDLAHPRRRRNNTPVKP